MRYTSKRRRLNAKRQKRTRKQRGGATFTPRSNLKGTSAYLPQKPGFFSRLFGIKEKPVAGNINRAENLSIKEDIVLKPYFLTNVVLLDEYQIRTNLLGYQQEQGQATQIKYSDSIRESRILWKKMQDENNKKNIVLDLSDPFTIVFSQPLSEEFFLDLNSKEGLEKISERAGGAKADFKRQYSFFYNIDNTEKILDPKDKTIYQLLEPVLPKYSRFADPIYNFSQSVWGNFYHFFISAIDTPTSIFSIKQLSKSLDQFMIIFAKENNLVIMTIRFYFLTTKEKMKQIYNNDIATNNCTIFVSYNSYVMYSSGEGYKGIYLQEIEQYNNWMEFYNKIGRQEKKIGYYFSKAEKNLSKFKNFAPDKIQTILKPYVCLPFSDYSTIMDLKFKALSITGDVVDQIFIETLLSECIPLIRENQLKIPYTQELVNKQLKVVTMLLCGIRSNEQTINADRILAALQKANYEVLLEIIAEKKLNLFSIDPLEQKNLNEILKYSLQYFCFKFITKMQKILSNLNAEYKSVYLTEFIPKLSTLLILLQANPTEFGKKGGRRHRRKRLTF